MARAVVLGPGASANPLPPVGSDGGGLSGAVVRAQQLVWPLFRGGVLTVEAGLWRVYNDTGRAQSLRFIRLSVIGPPTGSDLILDVLVSAVSLFPLPSGRPRIAVGDRTSVMVPPTSAVWPVGGYLTVDIAAVGSTQPGSDLQIQITTES